MKYAKIRKQKINRNRGADGLAIGADTAKRKPDVGNGAIDDGGLSSGGGVRTDERSGETRENKSPHFSPDRRGHAIEAIVIHRTAGTLDSAIGWVANPQSKVSYHAIIDEKGTIHKIIADEQVAWHAGRVVKPTWTRALAVENPNLVTLGVALSGKENDRVTLEQFVALAVYVSSKCKKHNLPIDEAHVIGHNEIRADKACPGVVIRKLLPALLAVSELERLETQEF